MSTKTQIRRNPYTGTTVNVLTGDDLAGGTWTDRAELIVQGTGILNAVGTSGSPITFKSADNPTGKDAWGGIRVQSGGSATFRYVTVQNAREAVYQAGSINWGTAADAATKINNSLTGIRASGLNAQTIDDADMDEVFTAVLLENNSTSTTIQHIRAKQVTPSNDPIIKVTGGSSNHVENTTLIGSANVYLGTGILLENTSSPQILNNHIQSVGLGIQGTGNTSNVSITYNNLWNIGLQAFSGVSVSTTNYAVEPRFKAVTPPTFELETNSPLINAGTPSGRDMGRYGGTTLDQTTAQASIFFSTSYVQDHSGFTPVSGSWSYDGPNQWYSQTDPWAGPSRSTHGGSSAASCTIGAKVRMTGGYSYGELKLIYANANVDESYRIDLMYGYQKVRLITAAGTWEQPNVTLTANTWYRVKALIANGNISVYLDDAPLANLGTKSIGGSPTKTFAVGTYVASANFDEVYVIDENTGGGGTGESLSFTASQRQEVGVGLVSTTGNQYTVEAWAKVNSASGIYEIVGQNADGNDCKGTLIILDGKVRLELNTPAYTALFSSSTVPPNTWTHVAGVYDGSSMKIYINGNLDAQTSKSGNITSRNVRSTQLGGYGGTCGCSYWFDGLIDEVRIWNVARTQTQIQTDKNHEISAQSGLIGYWRFNEGSGSTTADNSGNGHTGILTNYAGSGMPSWVTQGFPASKEIVRGEEELLPTVTRLTNNYPNPFNPETIIRYEVAEWEQVRLEIYNILGQQVRVLVDEPQAQGRYQAVWDGRDGQHQEAASGMYFYRLITPTLTQTHKMVLVR